MICLPLRQKRCGLCLPNKKPGPIAAPRPNRRTVAAPLLSHRTVAVLRPEPGNRATIARLADARVDAVSLPLFAVQALAWSLPDPTRFDALVLTSANAVRWAGDGLAALRGLPVHAVGQATAAAARDSGFDIMATGDADADALLAAMARAGITRALHLGGRESMITPGQGSGAIVRQSIPVYASEPVPVPPRALAAVAGGVALLHSPRAARRLAALMAAAGFARSRITIAALSPAVAMAAGDGWSAIWTAPVPSDEALVRLVAETVCAP